MRECADDLGRCRPGGDGYCPLRSGRLWPGCGPSGPERGRCPRGDGRCCSDTDGQVTVCWTRRLDPDHTLLRGWLHPRASKESLQQTEPERCVVGGSDAAMGWPSRPRCWPLGVQGTQTTEDRRPGRLIKPPPPPPWPTSPAEQPLRGAQRQCDRAALPGRRRHSTRRDAGRQRPGRRRAPAPAPGRSVRLLALRRLPEQAGLQALAIDLRCYGKSACPQADDAKSRVVDDVAGAVAALRAPRAPSGSPWLAPR
jgi:hypothetical protein